VLLAEVALLSQSRGSLYATPVMLVLVFVLLPGRVRTFAVLVPVAAGIAAATPSVLRVGDKLTGGESAIAAIHSATAVSFSAALLVGLAVALGAAIESKLTLSPTAAKRLRTGLGAIAIATLVSVLAGGWVAVGDPVARARHAWDTFKSEKGYSADASGSRLTSGLGSTRYDLYRVAVDEFVAHPLFGIGADNIQQQYLRHGRSHETPHYPHSVELRVVAQTGLVGVLLAIVGLLGALLAATRAVRETKPGRLVRWRRAPPPAPPTPPLAGADPLGSAVAAAALSGFAYWVVHGSFDWFWEFAGLGAPAFALLGLACALSPSRRSRTTAALPPVDYTPTGIGLAARTQLQSSLEGQAPRRPARNRRSVGWRVGIIACVLFAVAGAISLAAPWLSQLEVQSAARVWTKSPLTAYARLEDAARLDPLSDQADLVAGTIALRFGDLARADHEFSLALERSPADAYATLERGVIASNTGDGSRALRLLDRAAQLNPRDRLTREALLLVRQGRRIDIEELNRSILFKARQLR
jgi:hypothetical protein